MSDIERIKVNSEDFNTVCICAVRYALGRHTYMPGIVVGFVISVLDHINERARNVMIRDIEEYIASVREADKLEKPLWEELLDALKGE